MHPNRTDSQPLGPVTSKLKKAVRIGVAVDGSLVSEKALRTAAMLVNKSRRDRQDLIFCRCNCIFEQNDLPARLWKVSQGHAF